MTQTESAGRHWPGGSVWVVKARALQGTMGDGGQAALNQRTRSNTSFTKYVPPVLILIGFNGMPGINA